MTLDLKFYMRNISLLLLILCLGTRFASAQFLNVQSPLLDKKDPIEKSKIQSGKNLLKDQRFDIGMFLYLNFFTDLNVVVLENPKTRVYKPEISKKILYYYLDNVAELNEAVIQDYFNRGLARIDSSKYEEAMNDFDRCLVYDPENADAYLNRGVLFIISKQYPEALDELNKAQQFDPENAAIYFNRGVVYYNQQLNKEALDQLEICLKKDPEYTRAYFEKGVVLAELGNYQEALGSLRKARNLGDPDAGAYIDLVKTKKESNNPPKN